MIICMANNQRRRRRYYACKDLAFVQVACIFFSGYRLGGFLVSVPSIVVLQNYHTVGESSYIFLLLSSTTRAAAVSVYKECSNSLLEID
jgi:hypothetical protein